MSERGRHSGQKNTFFFKQVPHFFPTFIQIVVNLKIVWVDFDIRFSAGEAISLNSDCFSILTRVSENHFLTCFRLFPDFFFKEQIEISVEYFILDLVWERLSRSLLTAFRFWLAFRTSFFFFPIFRLFADFSHLWNECTTRG